jgi:hypothetical protein
MQNIGSGRWFYGALLAIALVAAAVRTYSPPSFPADVDEAYQFKVIQAPWNVFWRTLRIDAVHPPLDYLVDRAMFRISPALLRLRVPVILWGSLTVAVFGLLLRNRCGAAAGILGAVFLALATYDVVETRRLRPYALATLALCLALYFLDRLFERPGGGRAALYSVASAICLSTLYVAGVTLIVASLALAAVEIWSGDEGSRSRARRAIRHAAIADGLALAASVPSLLLGVGAIRRAPPHGPPVESPARVGRVLSYLAFSPHAGYSFPPRWVFLGGFVLAIALFAGGLVAALMRPGSRFFAGWGVLGIATVEALKRVHPHFDAFRYFLPAGVALTSLWAIGLARLFENRRLGTVAVVVFLAVVALDAVSLSRYYRFGVWRFSTPGGAGRMKTISSGLTRPSLSRAIFSSS